MKQALRMVSVILILAFGAAPALAQEEAYIRDILDTPQRYYNLQVLIKAEVVDVEPAVRAGQRGYYVALDNSDKTIKVVANELPAPGKKFNIIGIVQVDTSSQEAYIRESSRLPLGMTTTGGGEKEDVAPPQKEGLDPLIIGLGALIVLVIIVLLVVILKKPQSQQSAPAQPAAPPTSAGTEPVAAPKVDKRTRQVSTQEVISKVGAPKTTQVPSLLAQLVVKSGDLAGKSFPLRYETTIGRETGDVILNDSSVSRTHATLHFVKDKYVLENKSETNPVVLNGQKVTAKKELKDGDEIICGFVKLEFKLI